MTNLDAPQRRILAAFDGKPRTTGEIAKAVGMTPHEVGACLQWMHRNGAVNRCEKIHGIRIWEAVTQ